MNISNKKPILISSIVLLVLTVSALGFKLLTTPKLDAGERMIEIDDIELAVEIADEPHEQTQGLSGRESLAMDHGMLFIFPYPLVPGFWMKDMKFSIDIIWIDESGTIIGIEKNFAPDTYPKTVYSLSPIKYVLEVNAGWSDKNGIEIGDRMEFE